MSRSMGRFDLEEKKKPGTKEVGPQSYKTEDAFKKNSTFQAITTNVNISGLGKTFGLVEHKDKMKVKSNRFLDQVVKQATKQGSVPGVGHYKNLDKAYERQASLPACLKSKRH